MMMKQAFPIHRSLELNVYATREAMGKAAAQDVAAAMKKYLKEKGKAVVVFAAAPSQDEFLFHLSRMRGIDWSQVICFHLDEYVDLPRSHPNTFEVYLREHLFDLVKPKTVYYLKAGKGNPREVARQYAKQVQRHGGLDISCIGIGENGHVAFNEPGSDLEDPETIRIITIDNRSVKQQYRDYKDHPNPAARYASLKAVPRKAWTLTVPAILSAKEIYTIVPAPQKAEAVKKMWEGPVSSACPSSALRRHPRVRIYLDKDSASALK
jgi:glucosamine-6-phosphate deaminase